MDDIVEPILKAFLGQMDSAMKISEILSTHENSDEITVDHLITGLVYRLIIPMSNEEIDDALERAQQMLDACNEEGSNEDDTYDTLDECYDERGTQPIEFNRQVKANQCNCEICSKARVCLLNYKDHDCSDPLAQKFKKAIDTTCETHKIYI
jgi:redox-regulated HSP33 family molecular chaperone